MVLKQEIEKAYHLQQEDAVLLKNNINRNYYVKINIGSSHIEVVSGVRRCGKSTLLKQVMQQYDKNIAYFNFEDPRIYDFEVGDFQKLDEIIGKGKLAYFFDEIQNVVGWEVFVRQLHERGEKVFITGSNASLLSRELGTRLTGRYLRHELFPFSYEEFLTYKNLEDSELSFVSYVENGGFPEYLKDGRTEVLQNLLKDIVLRDIAIRYSIKGTRVLMDLTLFLLSNIGKETTYNSLKKAFSVGSANSISDYLSWLEDAYVLFFVPRFSWSAKSIAINPRKVYAIDNGLVNANSLSFTKDKGRLLENLVYLHLRQKYEKLFYFKDKGECDFVVFDKENCQMVIQVCEEVHSENKDREINGLIEAMKFFKLKDGFILTKNQKDELLIEGMIVKLIPTRDWMSL